MKRILILSNLISYTYNFRKEIIEAFIQAGHSVTIVADLDDEEKTSFFSAQGCKIIHIPYNGKGTSIKQDASVLITYLQIIRSEKPDVVFSYTIKPNLYGGIAAKLLRKNYIPMITGLGEVEKKGKLQVLLLTMHRFVMPYAKCVFFQNQDNIHFFEEHHIKTRKAVCLPGSGINLNEHRYTEYLGEENGIVFGFVGRLTPAKGIEQFLDAAEYFRKKNSNLHFYVAGKCDEQFVQRVRQLHEQGIITYCGQLQDTREFYKKIHCLVLPTYHPEGISNVLLESGACGRPAICTNRTGCKEVVENGINGFYCEAKNSENLISVMETFCKLSWEEKRMLGVNGRKKIANNFSRDIVVAQYMKIMEEVS